MTGPVLRVLRVALCALCVAGCSSGPPAHEVRRFHPYSYDRDLAAVRAACRAALQLEQCPVESDTEGALATPVVEDVGFTWRLTVDLRRGEGFVTVDPSLEIRRSGEYEAPRRTARAPGASPLDDPSARGASRDGSLHERQAAPRAGADAMDDRENRIRELERRVNRFVDSVAARLSAGK